VLYVSHGYDPETAYSQEFKIRDTHWLTRDMWSEVQNITFKIRHTPEFHRGKMSPLSPSTFLIRSEKPIHGVAPGQFCVIYDEQHHRCFGSAEITL